MANRVDFGVWTGSPSTNFARLTDIALWREWCTRIGHSKIGFRARGGFEGFNPGELIVKDVNDAIEVCRAGGTYSTNLNPRTGHSGCTNCSKTSIPYGDIAAGMWDAEIILNAKECKKVTDAVPGAKIYVEFHSEVNVQTNGDKAQPTVPDGPSGPGGTSGVTSYTDATRIGRWVGAFARVKSIFAAQNAPVVWVISMGRQASNWNVSNSPWSAYVASLITNGTPPDVIGVDGYCRTQGTAPIINQNFSPATLWDACRTRAEAAGIPWGIFETAHHMGLSGPEAADRAQWYLDLAAYDELHKAGMACTWHNVSEGLYDPCYCSSSTGAGAGFSTSCAVNFISAANKPVYTTGGGGGGGGGVHPQIAVIMLGKLDKASVTGTAAPNLTAAAASFEELTNFYGVDSFDAANYLALTCGSKLGRSGSDAMGWAPLEVHNIFNQVKNTSKEWRIYAEDWNAGIPGTDYVKTRDPAQFYGTVGTTALLPDPWHVDFDGSDGLAAAIAAGTMPDLCFIIPNKIHQGRAAGVGAADAWLGGSTPGFPGIAALRTALGAKGIVIVVYDHTAVDVTNGGGLVYCSISGPAKSGWGPSNSGATFVDHFDLLASIQAALGLAKFTDTLLEPTYTLDAGYSGPTTTIDLTTSIADMTMGASIKPDVRVAAGLQNPHPVDNTLSADVEVDGLVGADLVVGATAPVANIVRRAREVPV